MYLGLKLVLAVVLVGKGICSCLFENLQDVSEYIDKAVEKRFKNYIETEAKRVFEIKINEIVEEHLSDLDRITNLVDTRVHEIISERVQGISSQVINKLQDNTDAKEREHTCNKTKSEEYGQDSEKDNMASDKQVQDKTGDKSTLIKNKPSKRRYLVDGAPYPGGIGFTACVSVPDLTNLGDEHIIQFDKAITNLGNAYHENTGIFQAPMKGLYVFHMAAMSNPGNSQYLAFVKDGSTISHAYPHAAGSTTFENAAHLWVMVLEQGSEVWVQTHGAGQIHGNCFTTFSGFLLTELE